MSNIKVGDKVKSLVDYFYIRKGDVLTVGRAEEGYIKVTEHSGGDILLTSEYEKIEEVPSRATIEQLLSKANKHSAKAAKHEKKRQELIEQAKELLPDGWVLSETGEVVEESVEEDMTDPANWCAGDIVECAQDCTHHTKGCHYEVTEWGTGRVVSGGELSVKDNDGADWWAPVDNFKWHSRPSKETK